MKHRLVKEIMTSPAITIRPKETVIAAHEKMKEQGIRRLPVVANNVLLGIITLNDVREASPSSATSLSFWELNYLWSKLLVQDIMKTDVITIREDENVYRAAKLMMNLKISGLPVLNAKEEVAGVITESDIFRLLINEYEREIEDTSVSS